MTPRQSATPYPAGGQGHQHATAKKRRHPCWAQAHTRPQPRLPRKAAQPVSAAHQSAPQTPPDCINHLPLAIIRGALAAAAALPPTLTASAPPSLAPRKHQHILLDRRNCRGAARLTIPLAVLKLSSPAGQEKENWLPAPDGQHAARSGRLCCAGSPQSSYRQSKRRCRQPQKR
jgi:hypothetical protein